MKQSADGAPWLWHCDPVRAVQHDLAPVQVDQSFAFQPPSHLPQLPDVPTATEAGFPGIDGSVWYGFVVPTGTPRDIVLKLNDAAQKALADKEVIDTLVNRNALVIAGGPPERLAEVIRADLDKWSRIVRMTGFKPD